MVHKHPAFRINMFEPYLRLGFKNTNEFSTARLNDVLGPDYKRQVVMIV